MNLQNMVITDTVLQVDGTYWLNAGISLIGGGREVEYTFNFKTDEPQFGQFIHSLISLVGVDNWEDLKDKYVRIDLDEPFIKTIYNILNDESFDIRALYPPEEVVKEKLSPEDKIKLSSFLSSVLGCGSEPKEKHIVHYYESGRGWRSEEWTREFDSRQEALDEIQSVNQEYAVAGNKVPDYYIVATYKGVSN